jgi:NAD(P)-dependent dehydrogenase (short-subunit alcohol dehydrogenase family)
LKYALTRFEGVAQTPHRIINGQEQQFFVNHLAHFYLFHLLKPLLLKSSSSSFNSRVVVVASLVHGMEPMNQDDYTFEKRGYDPLQAYGQSKLANVYFANELERRYGSQGLHALSLHPGGIRTGLQTHHDPKYREMMEQMMEMPHIKKSLMSVEQGAATPVLAAIGKEYEGVGGFYMENCGVSPPFPEDGQLGDAGYKPWAYNKEAEQRLWKDSLDMLKLEDD